LIGCIGLIFIFITGCSNAIENEYEEFKKITNTKQVQEAKELLDAINWKNTKTEMTLPADYRFFFSFKTPEIEAKTVLYQLWISPNKDKVELVIHAENKYVQLDKNTSAELLRILTGKK
ncbi:MAG: hypothetical protein ABF649_16335, partial [Bacillus sp. (in: firmicutes)]